MKFKVYFMRGDVKEVEALSAAGAISKCYLQYPETISYDILKVINEEGEEV